MRALIRDPCRSAAASDVFDRRRGAGAIAHHALAVGLDHEPQSQIHGMLSGAGDASILAPRGSSAGLANAGASGRSFGTNPLTPPKEMR
jgi:hypothetical protein